MGYQRRVHGGFLFNYKLHAMSEGKKEHVSIAICGHVDSGKSTTTCRLIFDLGGVSEREMQKLKDEAERLGKSSFAFAFYMDTQKEERERGLPLLAKPRNFTLQTTITPSLMLLDIKISSRIWLLVLLKLMLLLLWFLLMVTLLLL